MVADSIDASRVRLAHYYLGQLRQANAAYQKGHRNSVEALHLFDRDWPYIQKWQAWAETHSDRDTVAASLCYDFVNSGVDILRWRLTPQQQIGWLESALSVARGRRDDRAEMWCLYHIANAYDKQGDSMLVVEYTTKSLVLARKLGEKYYKGLNMQLQGESERSIGNYAAARSLLKQSLNIFRDLGYLKEVSEVYRDLGYVAWNEGQWATAQDYYVQHLEAAIELGIDTNVCDALITLSLVKWILGDRPGAWDYLNRGLNLCRAIGYQHGLAIGLNRVGTYSEELGKLEEAIENYRIAFNTAEASGYFSDRAEYQKNLGYALTLVDDYNAGISHLVEAAQYNRELKLTRGLGEVLVLLASACGASGDIRQACESLREASTIAAGLNSRMMCIHVIVIALEILPSVGQMETAATWAGCLLRQERLYQESRDFVNALTAKLTRVLGDDQTRRAMHRGESLDPETIIRSLVNDFDSLFLQRISSTVLPTWNPAYVLGNTPAETPHSGS